MCKNTAIFCPINVTKILNFQKLLTFFPEKNISTFDFMCARKLNESLANNFDKDAYRNWAWTQGCHGLGKISGKWNFFQVREKSGSFVDGQGNLERTWKVREKSGNLKINGYGRQSSENYLFYSRGERMYILMK